MATLYTEQSKNIRRTWLLMSLFFVVIISLAWFISYIYNSPGILYAAVAFSLLMNALGYWFSDKVVIALTGARPVERKSDPELWNVVENLAIAAGLPMPKLYLIDDRVPNAFAAGRDKNHAAVAVTSGLRAILTRSELEGVIAHELSHIGNRDILVSTIVVVLVGFITILSDLFRRSRFLGRGRDRQGGLQGILVLAGLVLVILSPIVATLIQLAISRRREFLADASGALLTRYPEGLAGALQKISAGSGVMRRANNATAHLFIANPFGAERQKSVGFVQKLFLTHPPVGERIAALLGRGASI